MGKPVDAPRAYKLLEQAVEAKGPDFVYRRQREQSCQYFADGEPSCLIGHAMAAAGAFTSGVYNTAPIWLDRVEFFTAKGDPVSMTQGARRVFEQAQLLQDERRPWSEALHAAKSILGSLSPDEY